MDCGGAEGKKKTGVEGGRKLIKLLYTNCQSVINKRPELRATVSETKPDLICLTECWTNDTVDNEILGIENFELVVRKDRRDTANGRGGGILIYARSGLVVWDVEVETEFCQVVGVSVKEEGDTGETFIYVCYRSPNSSTANDLKLNEWIETLNGKYMLIGDFNYPNIKWNSRTCDGKGGDFLEVVERKFLSQHVEGGTHVSGNDLDLIFASVENMVVEVSKEGRLGSSDHIMLMCTLELNVKAVSGGGKRRDWKKADFYKVREDLSVNWEQILEGKNVSELWLEIKTRIKNAMDSHIPWKRSDGRERPRWMSSKIANLISKKKKLWGKCKLGTDADKRAYKKAEKELKKSIRNAKKCYEKKVAKEGKAHPKQFYAYLKRERGNRVRVGPLKTMLGELVTEPKAQADLLNQCYASVFTVPDHAVLQERVCLVGEEDKLVDVEYSSEKVLKAIEELRKEAAGGPDEIPPRVLKEIGREISKPLAVLFRCSMDEKRIPEEWRDSLVVPIYKGGSKCLPKNYRPVNLTVTCMKLKERIDREEIVAHIDRHELMSDSQHGFCKGRSCVTNLIEFQNRLTKWMDEGRPFDVFWLDFAKAFDKVDHQRLINSVKSFGIDGKLLAWIEDWLRGRRQRVVVEGQTSEWEAVLSSVVQGSVLGTLLFLIFINDIDENALAFVRKFADDTKGALVVENEEDAELMQRELNKMVEWAQEARMEFNVEKCKVMHVGGRNRGFKYQMAGQDMKETDIEKDLGVLVCDKLKPSEQCAKAAKKANAVLGQIVRAFHFRTKHVVGKLFKAFVRPMLEYAVAVWSPWTEKD